jgi:hypothetical protein
MRFRIERSAGLDLRRRLIGDTRFSSHVPFLVLACGLIVPHSNNWSQESGKSGVGNVGDIDLGTDQFVEQVAVVLDS